MDLLERIWEGTGSVMNGVLSGIERGLTGLFGSSNTRNIKKYQAKVLEINELEARWMAMSDAELKDQTNQLRARLRKGETLDDILVEAFATCREGGRRFLKMRHYDVQLIGGMVLHGGNIAEMVTGEGKTLVATLPTYLNALAGSVHVVTVNDYLARRDMEWMGPLYMGLGLTVGSIQSGMDNDERQTSYACDITYGTNNEFGFDYLRDNMRLAAHNDDRFPKHMQQVQGPLHFAVIDEVDNILIDEARTPLIISGPAHQDVHKYAEADRIARTLEKEKHFVVNEKDHNVSLTDDGVRTAEKLAGVESFYTAGNMEWPHLIDNALKAHHLYKLDVNYVVKEGAIIIVDEFTGRLMDGRQWSDGLHQAVEAKEGVRIKEETQTLATITLQNFFKLYKKISGMTGTAMTEATEFMKIYGLDVVAIPTNRGMQRIEHPDVIYLTEKEKFHAVADDVEQNNRWDQIVLKNGDRLWGSVTSDREEMVSMTLKEGEKRNVPRAEIDEVIPKGRPILVGTVSIEKSERLSQILERRGVKHQVLNAKNHGREAEIIAQAGRMGAVTIATNMAGRGTDIILGGNPETMAWAKLQSTYETRLDVPREEWDSLVHEIEQQEKMKQEGDKVRGFGGLYVIGTERHESRRIDLQLRGRCGRQGDPGVSRFYLSLEDDLMRIFAGDWVRSMMERIGMKDGESIESKFISKRISAAQRKVEERNFEVRKNLLEYDEVMDTQRKGIYGYRQRILNGESCRELVVEQLGKQIEHYVKQFTDPMYGPECFARWAGQRMSCQLEPKDFRTTDPSTAEYYAKEQAERSAETQILDAIDENLPEGEEESEWNWEALCQWCNSRFGTNLRTNDLKKLDRDRIDEHLINAAREKLAAIDLADGMNFLDQGYGAKMLSEWMRNKFSIELSADEFRDKEPPAISKALLQKAEAAYRERECLYPVIAGFSRFSKQQSGDIPELHVSELLAWAEPRFKQAVPMEPQPANGQELFDRLLTISRQCENSAQQLLVESKEMIADLFAGRAEGEPIRSQPNAAERLGKIRDWLATRLDLSLSDESIQDLDRDKMQKLFTQSIDDRFFPEIRRMERQVVLNIVDSSWKDHLLAMDHLRSAIGLKGYAQMDPKVEYKREGMRLFGQMWSSIGERVTDAVFRMEVFNDEFVQNTWVETAARHETFTGTSELLQEQEDNLRAADQAGESSQPLEPIRNRTDRVGRNDSCPCGSGKKFKNCCMRRQI